MVSLDNTRITFIGGGNMAAAIVGGLLQRGIKPSNIWVAEPWEVNREKMKKLGVNTTTSNTEAGADADVVVISVKPQVVKTVSEELAAAWKERSRLPICVSIAAGVGIESIQKWLTVRADDPTHVVRVMPNTPALAGEGASGLTPSKDVTWEEKELVDALFKTVSPCTEWVDDEKLLDVVTGVSGSGPAYFFAMVEHLTTAGKELGLSEEQAARLAKQTCFGAGKMLVQSSESAGQLRTNVTSPNGTTYAGLQVLEKQGFQGLIRDTVGAAASRGEELGKEMAKL